MIKMTISRIGGAEMTRFLPESAANKLLTELNEMEWWRERHIVRFEDAEPGTEEREMRKLIDGIYERSSRRNCSTT